MITNYILTRYIALEFGKKLIVMSLGFLSLGFLITLFEEINSFKDFDVGFDVPILLTILFVPSMFYEMFPFVILLSGIWYFAKLKKNDEIIALKVSGLSNFSVIIVPSILSLIIGIFFITTINPITSVLVKNYELIKGDYEENTNYLASMTVNGIWIKERSFDKNYIVKSSKLSGQKLLDLTIYEFDKNNTFIQRVDAESADISSLEWKLKNAQVIDANGKLIINNIDYLNYKSMYDIKKIKSFYSNLNTISFWNLNDEIQLLNERGYSTSEMRSKLQRTFAFPFFLLSMVMLSGVFTLGMNFKDSNWTYAFIAIFTSVLVFYFNDFSAALGKTNRLPIEVSVWMPIIIIFIFGSVGVIHANQK